MTAKVRPRDSQFSKYFAAEEEVFDYAGGRQFESIAEIQVYVTKLVRSAWWKRRYPAGPILVQAKHHGAATASSYFSTISLPRWAWYEAVVLHEVCHIATDRAYSRYIPAHGRHFAKTYLDLIGHKLGIEYRRALKAAFVKHRVKHSLPRKPMSEEQRKAAAERLAQVRAA